MLTAMIFASNADSQARIQRRCVNAGNFNLFRSPDYRPSASDMIRLINSYSPEIVLIEFYDREDVLKIEGTLRASFPKLAILGFAHEWKDDPTVKTSKGEMRIIPASAPLDLFKQGVMDAVDAVRTDEPDNLIVFLPSKAGSGASTVALNIAGMLAGRCARSSALIEADLHSGPAGMYLDINPKHSVVDALTESHRLDSYWNDVVTMSGNLAILPASNIRGPIPQPSPWDYKRLMSFAKLRYQHVVFDLPEVVNLATEAIVLAARTVYVVCTPEVPSLVLARKRSQALVDRGVAPERLKIVLNRFTKGGPEPAAVEEILGRRIEEILPNDYKAVWTANLERNLVAEKSALGKAFESFALKLAGGSIATAKPARRLFGLFPAA